MSDLGDLIAQAGLGEQPATITVDVYARALAEINTARADCDDMTSRALTLKAELDQACVERDWLLAEAPDELRGRFFAVRAKERPDVGWPRRATHGTKLCPRCGEALAAEVAAENTTTEEGETL